MLGFVEKNLSVVVTVVAIANLLIDVGLIKLTLTTFNPLIQHMAQVMGM